MPQRRQSNTPKHTGKPYHHGDLRSALIQSALEILRTEGSEGLSLRAVARAAGVSQTAPYRHFSDRRELVAAVAEEGFRQLGEVMTSAMQRGEGRAGFRQVADAYVRFAHEHEPEYRIMFGPELARHDDLPGLKRTSHSVLAFVRTGIERLQQAGVIAPGDPAMMAVSTWATLHGLVMLSLDGQAEASGSPLEKLVETTTHLIMFGMSARA